MYELTEKQIEAWLHQKIRADRIPKTRKTVLTIEENERRIAARGIEAPRPHVFSDAEKEPWKCPNCWAMNDGLRCGGCAQLRERRVKLV